MRAVRGARGTGARDHDADVLEPLADDASAFSKAARTTIAVPC